MVNLIVNKEEAVVEIAASLERERWVLRIVASRVKAKGWGDLGRIDGGVHPLLTLGEHLQNRIVHVVINQHQTPLRGTDQITGEGVGIKNLPIGEDTLHRRKGGADEEVDLGFYNR